MRRLTPAPSWLCVAACLGSLALIAPLGVAAQSADELAEARRLFTAGLEAAEAHRWQEARDLFEQSLAVTERASTLLNLAAAQAETGAVVEAAASYRRFLEIATGRDARHRDEAEEALARVEARIAHLELDTTLLLPGDRVEVDELTIVAGALDTPLGLDAGTHRITVRRDEAQVFDQTVALTEGARLALAIEIAERVEAAPAEPVDEPAPVALPPATRPIDGGGNDDAVWIGLGVTAGVLVALGVVVGVVFATMPTASGELYMGNVGDGVIRF